MAVPKKGWRKITVNEKQYFWRAIGTDWGINGVIVTDEAFVRGQSSQQLLFNIDYDHDETPLSGGVIRLQQQAVISPGLIRLAIKLGMKKHPPFTGEVGKENIILQGNDIDVLQEKAHQDLSKKEI